MITSKTGSYHVITWKLLSKKRKLSCYKSPVFFSRLAAMCFRRQQSKQEIPNDFLIFLTRTHHVSHHFLLMFILLTLEHSFHPVASRSTRFNYSPRAGVKTQRITAGSALPVVCVEQNRCKLWLGELVDTEAALLSCQREGERQNLYRTWGDVFCRFSSVMSFILFSVSTI